MIYHIYFDKEKYCWWCTWIIKKL